MDAWERPAPTRDEFLRVWRRVTPRDTPDSPVTVYDIPSGQAKPDDGDAFAWIAPGAGRQEAAALPAVAAPRPAVQPDQTVYAVEGLLLRERMSATALRTLAQRTDGRTGRRLLALAAEAERAARLLAADIFLLTGARYRPSVRLPTPWLPEDDLDALRECYITLRDTAALTRVLAETASDVGLQALYRSQEEEARGRLTALRELVSQKTACRSRR